jgi:hypothetical protein
LPFDPALSPAYLFVLEAHAFYQSIIPTGDAAPQTDQEHGLGGKLLYAGELDQRGRALVVAGNVAGAASLSASADPTAQKQVIREGVVDFLVNSLDEALRILKNEIRKHNAVAVCVAVAPAAVNSEMLERGVRADLDRDSLIGKKAHQDPALLGAGFTALEPQENRVLVSWCVGSSPARWLPKLDAIAMECLKAEAWSARRWLRLAPRYLGRTAGGVRVLLGEKEFADRFVEQVRQRAGSGEIGTEVQIQVGSDNQVAEHRILPEANQPPS